METSSMVAPSGTDEEETSLTQVCYGCNLPIIDKFLLKVLDKLWHDRCLRCSRCHVALKEKCFSRDSNLYCKQDFYKVYGVQCAGCDHGIYPSDLIRRVGSKIFHMSCLKCCQCGQEVSTGDHLYILNDGTFLCKLDYNYQEHLQVHNNNNNKDATTTTTTSLPLVKVEHNNMEHDEEHTPTTPSSSTNGDNQMSDEEEEPNRRRGPRTTIKAKQLEVLKSAFLATPKPSRHIREKLAEDTGLTMRVIQVWFQNRRSKERRVKQLSVHDARRGFKKGKESSDPITYPFFHNPVSIADAFHQRRFTFNLFGNTCTTNSNTNTTLLTNDDSCNNGGGGGGNIIPLSLPVDPTLMRKTQETTHLKTPKKEPADYPVETFTSQLQEKGFKGVNAVKGVNAGKSFSPPAATPRSTYERL